MRSLLLIPALCVASLLQAQSSNAAYDSDRDGLSDSLEQRLLHQFAPRWMADRKDCAVRPASFRPDRKDPFVLAENGTVYGQVFPLKDDSGRVEIHFYDLWSRDCGQLGHALDTEHVATLVQPTADGSWKALYWYASAHEDTVCDASRVTRASTIHAESHGATVWISSGKHGSFLAADLCRSGCGGDRCGRNMPLLPSAVVNLGERDHPMNGSAWVASTRWPLALKMSRTDFADARLARLEQMPENAIAWVNPARRPGQAAILGGNSAIDGVTVGGRSTDAALSKADASTGDAIQTAAGNTGRALSRSFHAVRRALGAAGKSSAESLGLQSKEADADAQREASPQRK